MTVLTVPVVRVEFNGKSALCKHVDKESIRNGRFSFLIAVVALLVAVVV